MKKANENIDSSGERPKQASYLCLCLYISSIILVFPDCLEWKLPVARKHEHFKETLKLNDI